ncbi:hypothetical protein ACI65C_003867 [Semiaphis heraclei]
MDQIRTKNALKSSLNYKCISKLGLLTQLEGHQGCVNCLQWNGNGSTLASASDDYQVILWDPFLQKVKTTIKTLHRGNIFSVKFIPNCNDDIVATGAGDWSSHTYNVTTGKQLTSCICSQGRIKRLAVANDVPSVYWCASEDGCISQHDMRMSHECPHGKSKTTLVTVYGDLGKKIEAKCLDINQLRTEQLAVGANDQYVRLYDRRMIQSLSSFAVKYPYPKKYVSEYDAVLNDANNALQYFVPGHTHLNDNDPIPNRQKSYVITYLTFSPDGQELLVNYGGEYVYLYNLANQADNAFINIPKVMKVPRENGEGSSTDLIDDPVPVPQLTLPDKVVQLKLKANYLFEKEDYTGAIILYNEAISIHKCSVLFSNRAAAYIKRRWNGDYYAALKDCVSALKLEPNHMKAHFRLAVCLYELDKLKDSKMYLDQFTMKYPSYKTSAAYKYLHSDLLNAQSINDKSDGKKTRETLDTTSNVLDALHIEQTQKINVEKYFRNRAKDYDRRYYGHCNTSTDIKEANFFGNHNQFIVAGSDDGLFFIWEKNTENNLLILKGDSSIVNCIQPHPTEFLLATSGIDNEVKLWSPLPDDVDNTCVIKQYTTTATLNQRRMMADPFEVILRNMRRTAQFGPDSIDLAAIRDQYGIDEFNDCRMS